MEGLDVLEGQGGDVVLNSASNAAANDVKCNVEGLGWWIGWIMEDLLSWAKNGTWPGQKSANKILATV